MKSLTSDENESDERLLRYAEPNEPQVALPEKRAEKAIDVSPKVYASCDCRGPPSAVRIALVLTEPRARLLLPPLITVAVPQAEPDHVRIEIAGTVPPFERS